MGTDCNHSALSRGEAWGHRGLVELTPYHPPQGIELPVMRPEVPPWLLPPGRCLSGGQRCPASLPVAPASGDGPRLTADVGAMAGMVGASRRAVPNLGASGFGIPRSKGAMQQLGDRVSEAIVPQYDALGVDKARPGQLVELYTTCPTRRRHTPQLVQRRSGTVAVSRPVL